MKKVFFLITVLSLSSCATIILGSRQPVSIASSPSNAQIYVNGELEGKTPKSINIKKSEAESFNIKIELEGYEPYETVLSRKTSGWIAGNIVFGGLIGLIIDAATGSMYKLSPEEINAQLGGSAMNDLKKNEVIIMTTLNPDPDWEKIGSLKRAN
ncbi:PEGA domain-containing protein [Ekhidna sp.]|uniref:PEGA domain-containing protein n=1 Tax=Ekhidna sp. TaxID=2608089 RepID=UPI003B5A35B9